MIRLRTVRRLALAALMGSCPVILSGCVIGALVGGMAESYQETASVERPAQYLGLQDHTFALIVSADRSIQAEFQGLVSTLTIQMTNELAVPERTNALGVVPGPTVLQFQYDHPDWYAWSYPQLAEELGVDRLIMVDLYDFRLYEVGNVHLWDGRAAARVGVLETDGGIPGDFSFTREIQVRFPDQSGYGPSEIPARAIRAQLSKRLIDRVTWLFYDHMEKYRPDY